MLSQEIRRRFIQYFQSKGHAHIPSSPVVPHNDPTLLFNNAGMNQFKDVFLGESVRDYTQATTSQKCIRVGGKHNDLENVGHTSRHLTFFEMLGNFSFGEYFKEEAIQFAWEISTEVFGFEPELIFPTIYTDDEEAFEIWKKIVPEERITRFGKSENFWQMGETGPCGPCSELYYDRGKKFGSGNNPTEDPDGERYLEFWNLVFMQFNQQSSGQMDPLPKPSIDTGAGLERIISLKMGVDNVFETDILSHLIQKISTLSGVKYSSKDERSSAFHVIADHMRMLSFSIADGVQPSNVERGYVLRKVLRRGVRYGRQLGFNQPFLSELLPALIETMGPDYPELQKSEGRIAEILHLEEEAFLQTLRRGGKLLQNVCESAKAEKRAISGDEAFKLKDTYGLPFEEIELIAKDHHLGIDTERYLKLQKQAKELSKAAHKTTHQIAEQSVYEEFSKKGIHSEFIGYKKTQSTTQVKQIIINGTPNETLQEGQEAEIILDQTPFYAEKGGQIGDTGTLQGAHFLFEVSDCKNPYGSIIVHIGTLKSGSIKVGDEIEAIIDSRRRHNIACHHSATHLMHWALEKTLGEHIQQKGSLVADEYLRFDFSHHKAMSAEEIRSVEERVNEKILGNDSIKTYELSYPEAQKDPKIKQFFGDKYGSTVRVVDIDFSRELCGGTHVKALGSIGMFRILRESSIAAGVRRIEAVCGLPALRFCYEKENLLNDLLLQMKSPEDKASMKLKLLIEQNQKLEKEIEKGQKAKLKEKATHLISQATEINGIAVVVKKLDLSSKELKKLMQSMNQFDGAIACGCIDSDKAHIAIKLGKSALNGGLSAKKLLQAALEPIEGRGGGKDDMAQAGGTKPEGLDAALCMLDKELKKELS